ncbi:MAG TPA: hypothetical protein VK995_00780 [Oceanipulchritudo sp.]|nr:hypothetical protein [Oceanipulchritudo sp.]
MALGVGLTLFMVYFPGLLHQDSQTRWVWAQTALKGSGVLNATDFWPPLMTGIFYEVLRMGWPVWTVFVVQLFGFFVGYVLLVHRLMGTLLARIAAAVALLIPATWHYAALQSSDSWLTIGLMWLLWGYCGQLKQGSALSGRVGRAGFWLDLLAMLFGGVFLFSTRYNAAPLILPLLLLPFLLKLPWRSGVVISLVLICSFSFSKVYRGPVAMEKAYTVETLMAIEIVGIWKELHLDHPEAAPSFVDEIPDWESCFANYDPFNQDSLVWKHPFFKAARIGPIAGEIRADYWRYAKRFPFTFAKVKTRTFASPFLLTDPVGPWYFRPTPDVYLDLLGIPFFSYRPPSLATAVFTENILWKTFAKWDGLFRPWVWWLIWIALLAWAQAMHRVDDIDKVLFLLAAGYFLTFFPFSIGFLLRYAIPIWILFMIAVIRLALSSKHTHTHE